MKHECRLVARHDWVPKRNAGTNMRMEKTAGAVFSAMLTGRGNFGGASEESAAHLSGGLAPLSIPLELTPRRSACRAVESTSFD